MADNSQLKSLLSGAEGFYNLSPEDQVKKIKPLAPAGFQKLTDEKWKEVISKYKEKYGAGQASAKPAPGSEAKPTQPRKAPDQETATQQPQVGAWGLANTPIPKLMGGTSFTEDAEKYHAKDSSAWDRFMRPIDVQVGRIMDAFSSPVGLAISAAGPVVSKLGGPVMAKVGQAMTRAVPVAAAYEGAENVVPAAKGFVRNPSPEAAGQVGASLLGPALLIGTSGKREPQRAVPVRAPAVEPAPPAATPTIAPPTVSVPPPPKTTPVAAPPPEIVAQPGVAQTAAPPAAPVAEQPAPPKPATEAKATVPAAPAAEPAKPPVASNPTKETPKPKADTWKPYAGNLTETEKTAAAGKSAEELQSFIDKMRTEEKNIPEAQRGKYIERLQHYAELIKKKSAGATKPATAAVETPAEKKPLVSNEQYKLAAKWIRSRTEEGTPVKTSEIQKQFKLGYGKAKALKDQIEAEVFKPAQAKESQPPAASKPAKKTEENPSEPATPAAKPETKAPAGPPDTPGAPRKEALSAVQKILTTATDKALGKVTIQALDKAGNPVGDPVTLDPARLAKGAEVERVAKLLGDHVGTIDVRPVDYNKARFAGKWQTEIPGAAKSSIPQGTELELNNSTKKWPKGTKFEYMGIDTDTETYGHRLMNPKGESVFIPNSDFKRWFGR